jgi:SlyX protein
MTESETERRLTACEIAIAHLTRVNDDLSEIVAQQQTKIARLEKRVDLLMAREAEREAQGGEYLADQRPPHW